MEVLLFKNFSKRKNSTKQPVDSSGVTKTVRLKGECDYINPSFFISDVEGYVYLKAWGNYYYIHRVAYDINGAQYINCNIDVLATWKSQIQATSAFVELSSSDYSANLIDGRISQLVTRTRDRSVQPSLFVNGFTGGCYALSTANSWHGACTYVVDQENLELLINDLIYESPTEIANWEELFGDAMGAVIGIRYIPIPYSHFGGQEDEEEILLGAWNSGYLGIIVNGQVGENRTMTIPWRYSDFRRCSDFTRFALALPFVGIVELKPENLIGYENFTIQMVGNIVTGSISYSIVVGSPTVDKIVATYNANFGRQIPVAQAQVDLTGILNSGIAAGGAWVSALLGGPQAVALGVIGASAIKALVSANLQDFTIVGGYSGSFGEVLINNYELVSITTDSRTEPSDLTSLYGRPCMKVVPISTLTGYVKTLGFSIDISALDIVKQMINSAMDSGVYLE